MYNLRDLKNNVVDFMSERCNGNTGMNGNGIDATYIHNDRW